MATREFTITTEDESVSYKFTIGIEGDSLVIHLLGGGKDCTFRNNYKGMMKDARGFNKKTIKTVEDAYNFLIPLLEGEKVKAYPDEEEGSVVYLCQTKAEKGNFNDSNLRKDDKEKTEKKGCC